MNLFLLILILLGAGCAVTRAPLAEPAAEAVKQSDLNPARTLTFVQSFQGAAQPETVIAPAASSVVLLPGYENLTWNASQSSDVTGYNLYYGDAPRSYTYVFSTGAQTETTVSNLSTGATYYFAVTAVSNEGIESDFSDELAAQIPQMLELHFAAPGTTLLSSTDLQNWQPRAAALAGDAWRVKMDPTLPMEFFRPTP